MHVLIPGQPGLPWRGVLRLVGLLLGALVLDGGLAHARPGARVVGAPVLDAEGDPAAGHVTLHWHGGGDGARYELQEAASSDFGDAVTRYRGQDHASVLSGLPDGVRHYRVRSQPVAGGSWGPWSEPTRFSVAHHPLSLAFTLFGLGAAIFFALVAYLVTARSDSSHD